MRLDLPWLGIKCNFRHHSQTIPYLTAIVGNVLSALEKALLDHSRPEYDSSREHVRVLHLQLEQASKTISYSKLSELLALKTGRGLDQMGEVRFMGLNRWP